MLSPIKFANDISENPRYRVLTGKIDFPLMKFQDILKHLYDSTHGRMGDRWRARYRDIPYDLVQILGPHNPTDRPFPPFMILNGHYRPKRFRPDPLPPFSLDLVEAAKRQIVFARKITSIYPYDPVPEDILLDSQQRYAKFMNLIRENAVSNPVPALDIDLFWHTHQLEGTNYLLWCTHHVGRRINQDDTIPEGPLATGLQETTGAWEAFYGEDYLNPAPGSGPTFQNAAPATPSPPSSSRKPSTADKTPPPGLTLPQIQLWNFDVDRQIQHEKKDFQYRQKKETLRTLDEQIAGLRLGTRAADGGGGGALSRLFRAATVDRSQHATLLANRSGQEAVFRQIVRNSDELRAIWGRQRWPLLVAARGFGDPSVTAGAYVRPSQGSPELAFPIYPATWYDDKQMGYYDYVKGGKTGSGAIEGGGVRVGGAMCGGKFDGGNCAATLTVPRSTSAGCGGGG